MLRKKSQALTMSLSFPSQDLPFFRIWGSQMNRSALGILACLNLCFAIDCAAAPPEPPVVPVGYDAYRMWDHWPDQRIGVRAYMRSTYDRQGGNESADASHFLYQLRDDFNVTLDVEGPGILYFSRYNHWHGSPWHYVVDGADHVVQETTTADPLHPKDGATFIPASAFPPPLAWTWASTRGADLTWVPIGFESSFQMAYERTHYGTGYYIYHQFVRGTKLSTPIRAWDINAAPPGDVIELIGRAGQDLLPKVDSAEGKELQLQEQTAGVTVPAGQTAKLADLAGAAGVIRAINLSAPVATAAALSNTRLRITWDDRRQPSVDVPVPLFFGAGTLYNRDNNEYLVKAFPVNIRFNGDRVMLSCYFPMPFTRSARIELINGSDSPLAVNCSLRWMPLNQPANTIGYFHATYQDHPKPARGHDMVLLDTTQAEGDGDWSGSFIGTSFIFSHNANLATLEGDPRFFFDDSNTPQAQGTGTEEWGGGGDYWGGRNMTLPFAGHPTGAPQGKARSPEDAIESGYRFLLADLMPFGKNARIQLEHGGEDQSVEHYETVAYWYGIPAPSLVKTDTLAIADAGSETAHRYHSPDASARAKSLPATNGARITPAPRSSIPPTSKRTPHHRRLGIHAEAPPRQPRRHASSNARLQLPKPACRGLDRRRLRCRQRSQFGRFQACRRMVSGRLQCLRLFQPQRRAGRHRAQCAHLEPPFPG